MDICWYCNKEITVDEPFKDPTDENLKFCPCCFVSHHLHNARFSLKVIQQNPNLIDKEGIEKLKSIMDSLNKALSQITDSQITES